MNRRFFSLLALLATTASLPALLSAQTNYTAFELRRQDNWGPMRFVDLNGDQALDIAVPHYDAVLGRELHVYEQLDNGNFSAEPQRIEIKTEIIAIAFADLRPEPGEELILFASNGVFSLSSQLPGYTGNLKLLLQWNLLASIPDLEQVRFTNLARDINDDGHVDLLLPGDDNYELFLGQGNEDFVAAGEFTTLNADLTPIQRRSLEADLDAELSINSERGIVIDVNVDVPSPFAGFVQSVAREGEDQENLLQTDQWMPTATLAHLNADGLTDLAYINAGEAGLGRLNIHYQRPTQGIPAQADWQQDLDSSGDMRLTDVNDDGLADLMRLSGEGDDWIARFFLNRNGTFNLSQADQVMRFNGYEPTLDIIRLQENNAPVLSVSYYTIPVVDALRNASINRIQLIYANDSEMIFSARPVARLEESFSADNARALTEQMSLRFDVDGDGRKDALYITDNGTVAARRIDDELQIAPEPFWEYISPRSVFEFEVLSLNADDRPDLMLRHGNTTTLLVARP